MFLDTHSSSLCLFSLLLQLLSILYVTHRLPVLFVCSHPLSFCFLCPASLLLTPSGVWLCKGHCIGILTPPHCNSTPTLSWWGTASSSFLWLVFFLWFHLRFVKKKMPLSIKYVCTSLFMSIRAERLHPPLWCCKLSSFVERCAGGELWGWACPNWPRWTLFRRRWCPTPKKHRHPQTPCLKVIKKQVNRTFSCFYS